jgi:hypothetical protein
VIIVDEFVEREWRRRSALPEASRRLDVRERAPVRPGDA